MPNRGLTPEEVEVGDFVTVATNTLTWKVLQKPALYWREDQKREDGVVGVLCESGQSGRKATWPLDSLKMFKKGTS